MPTVLITGASPGIGRAPALRLAGSGWTVLAGVRRAADGEALKADGGERVIPDPRVPAELADQYGHVAAAMNKVVDSTERRGVPPEQVAETIERALTARRMRARYLIGRDAKAMLLAKRLLPDHVFDRVARRVLGV